MPINFNDFTQGTTLSETDQIVGFTGTSAGGERKWQLGNLRGSLITGAATTIDTENLAANKALVSDANGKVGASSVTSTEIGYLGGVTTKVQDSLVPAGAVMAFAMNAAPTGWLACDGSAVSRTTYNKLFLSIGTTYGVGDNTTTFNLPDLRGYFVRGSGTNSDSTASGTFGMKQGGTAVPMGDPSQTAKMVVSLYNNVDNNTSTLRDQLSGEPITVNDTSVKIISIVGTTDPVQASQMVMRTRPSNIAMFYCIKF